jgi:hypothetical protein
MSRIEEYAPKIHLYLMTYKLYKHIKTGLMVKIK